MRNSLRSCTLLGLLLVASASTARAQYGYPGGYGGMGWGGWGASTPQGDYARGMGVFAAGAGYYNEATAEATAINANTAANWNEYWYQSQQAVNRKYYAKMDARLKSNNAARESVYLRLRDNPEPADIYRGDAMNVIFDELSSPKIYVPNLKSAGVKYPGEAIRNIPFQYASQAVTATVRSVMTRGSAPDVLKAEPFAADLAKLRALGDKMKQENKEEDTIEPATIDEASAIVTSLQKQVAATLKPGTKDRNDADRFLKSVAGFLKMLRTPALNILLADVDKHPSTTAGQVLGFMKAFNLRFGVASTPAQRMAYDQLYPILVKMRDEAFPNRKPELAQTSDKELEHPADFFSKMDDKAFDSKHPGITPPAAPTPAPDAPAQPK